MSNILKSIPKDVTPKFNLGFSRPTEDVIGASYEATIYKSAKGNVVVVFNIDAKDKTYTWPCMASELLALESNPVTKEREILQENMVITIPADPNEPVTFRQAS